MVVLLTSADFCNKLFYPLIDCILTEIKDRFLDKTLSLLEGVSVVYLDNENFLNIDGTKMFCEHTAGDANAIKNEFMLIKPMLKNQINL